MGRPIVTNGSLRPATWPLPKLLWVLVLCYHRQYDGLLFFCDVINYLQPAVRGGVADVVNHAKFGSVQVFWLPQWSKSVIFLYLSLWLIQEICIQPEICKNRAAATDRFINCFSSGCKEFSSSVLADKSHLGRLVYASRSSLEASPPRRLLNVSTRDKTTSASCRHVLWHGLVRSLDVRSTSLRSKYCFSLIRSSVSGSSSGLLCFLHFSVDNAGDEIISL